MRLLELDLIGAYHLEDEGSRYIGRSEQRVLEKEAVRLPTGGPFARGCPVAARWRKISTTVWEMLEARRQLRHGGRRYRMCIRLDELQRRVAKLAAQELGDVDVGSSEVRSMRWLLRRLGRLAYSDVVE
eukprot:6996988-Pyramimonas_sp.AAC.1